MPTIPTGELERELRKRYLRFVTGLAMDANNLDQKLRDFEAAQLALIEKMGGRTAMLGSLGDFPVPKSLDLSPWAGTVYQEMQTAAIRAGIIAGSSSKEAAQAMFRAGMDKSYRKLERLARTETTNAYWKNAFNSIADLPLLVMLWGSEDGPRTCQWCRERDGLVISGSEVRDHPNGRCTPIPTLRSQVKYRGSVDRDGSMFYDPAWDKPELNRPASFQEVTGDPLSRDLDTQLDSRLNKFRPASYEDLPSGAMTSSQKLAVKKYTTTDFEDMNKALAKRTQGGADVPHWMKDSGLGIDDLAQALGDGDITPREFDAYKAWKTNLKAPKSVAEMNADELQSYLLSNKTSKDMMVKRGTQEYSNLDLKVGDSYTSPHIMSTSSHTSPNRDFDPMEYADRPVQMEIYMPAGTKGAALSSEQGEFALPHGTVFTVLEVRVAEVEMYGRKIKQKIVKVMVTRQP